ncbi:MAG: hypothetical protein IKV11_01040 [Alphaproteobacteria bacterium]|nr:hypothetical protein [Alphaproteobacteria bacterium]
MKKILLAGLALSVIFAGNSYAQEMTVSAETTVATETTSVPEQSAEEMMKNMTIKDAGEKFTLIDADGNDEITRTEYINFSLGEQAKKKAEGELEDEQLYNEDFYSAMFDDLDVAGRGAVNRIEYINKQLSDILGIEIPVQPVGDDGDGSYIEGGEDSYVETDKEAAKQEAIRQAQEEEERRIRAEEERVRKEEEALRKAEQEAREAEEEMMRMKNDMVANYDDEYEVVTRRRRR